MTGLADKVVVVTGAFGALGAAVSVALELAGARVARVDLAQTTQSGMVFGGVDLTDETAVSEVMTKVASYSGRIDGLVNIAGGFVWQTVAGGALENWEKMFRINLLTAVTASRAALGHMGKTGGGSIVNIGANAAARAGAGMGAYAASKSGVLRLTESLAEETADIGVRVNAILPSIIDTPANRRSMPKADYSTWVRPEDIARVVMFLLSEDSGAITGAAIPVTNSVRAQPIG